ncbi:CPBP family intramembrane glutamic endopeptidase [Halolamina salina]|uniref:CPBP family intramembrane glutamic endopeptidase n=1 Tax=Halolamina salina TaxID=1220023 RepID=A0ABD6B2V6_9EURY
MTRDSAIHDRFAAVVPATLPTRKLGVFLAIAFGLHWLAAGYLLLEGATVADRNFSAATYNAIIVAASFTPALATLLTRWLTDEGLGVEQLLLVPDFRGNWRTYLVAALVPLVLAVVGAVVYFAVFPASLAADPLAAYVTAVGVGGLGIGVGLATVAAVTLASLVLGAVMLLGEEVGWRAYLLPKLSPLGTRTATVLTGVLWGIWHFPFIYLGVNYPNATWLGMAAIAWVTTLYGTFLAWTTYRTGSVWPAAVGHAAFNTSSRWGPAVAEQTPNLAVGPGTGGVIGAVGWLVVAGWLLARSSVFSRGDAGASESTGSADPVE